MINSSKAIIHDKLISLAGLLNREITNQEGEQLGVVVDLVVRWDTGEAHPPLSGVIAKVARRHVWISIDKIEHITQSRIDLKSARLDLREYKSRQGEVRLAEEVLDHQLIDVEGARVVRASDLYLTTVNKHVRLVGVDVSLRSLLYRLGPRIFRMKPTPEQIIDWATIQSFGGQDTNRRTLKVSTHRNELQRMRPGELADLLEDLGRDERHELLTTLPTTQAADAIEEMEPEEVATILKESPTADAAAYLSNMEPDEAADALRDVDNELRENLLTHMTKDSAKRVGKVLRYDEATAGGFMNSALLKADGSQTVASIKKWLTNENADPKELDAVVIVDKADRLIYDLALVDLLTAEPDTKLSVLIQPPEPVTVLPDATINEVSVLLIESRRSSILVVDEVNRPIGRILADDVVDALLSQTSRFRFPRLLS